MPPSHYAATEVTNARLEMTEDRLLVRPAPEETMTKGGIVLPSNSRGKPTQGTVLAVGPGRISQEGHRIPMPYKEGQEVIYGSFSGTEIMFNGEDVLILKVPDVYAIIHRNPVEEESAEEAEA